MTINHTHSGDYTIKLYGFNLANQNHLRTMVTMFRDKRTDDLVVFTLLCELHLRKCPRFGFPIVYNNSSANCTSNFARNMLHLDRSELIF